MPEPDQIYYDIVGSELEQRNVKAGLWARAMAEIGSDDAKARARYVVLRVEELREESAREKPDVEFGTEVLPDEQSTATDSSHLDSVARWKHTRSPDPIQPATSRLFPQRLDRVEYLARWSVFQFLRFLPFAIVLVLNATSENQTLESSPTAVKTTAAVVLIVSMVFNWVGLLVWRMMAIDVPRIRAIGWNYTSVLLLVFPVVGAVFQVLLFTRPSRTEQQN